MRFGEQVGRAHEEEEPGVDGEQVAEALLADRDRGPDDRAEERRDRIQGEPSDCGVFALRSGEG